MNLSRASFIVKYLEVEIFNIVSGFDIMNCFIDRRPSKRKSESETALHGGNGSKADCRHLS